MAFVKEISYGTNGWNILRYTDDTKYIGYTKNGNVRNGYGTLYAKDGSIFGRGIWEDDELLDSIDEPEYSKLVNKTI